MMTHIYLLYTHNVTMFVCTFLSRQAIDCMKEEHRAQVHEVSCEYCVVPASPNYVPPPPPPLPQLQQKLANAPKEEVSSMLLVYSCRLRAYCTSIYTLILLYMDIRV